MKPLPFQEGKALRMHTFRMCVSLASTSATHLNNSLIAAIMTAQLPWRGVQGQEAAASVTIVFYPLATGTARPCAHQWCLERGCIGATPQQLQVPYSPFSPLLQAAEDSSHPFQLIPNTWFGFFFRCSCAPVTTCFVFPSSELNILNSLSQGKDLLLHRAGFLFSSRVTLKQECQVLSK